MIYSYCPKCGNKYNQQTEQNKFTCSACSFVFYLNSKPTASTIIVSGNKILLGKRRIEPSKGKWDVIGGFLDLGEQPEDGAKREAKEETGLDVEIEGCLGFFIDTYETTGDKTLNICFVAKVLSGEATPGDDIEELAWFATHELPKDIAFQNGQDMLNAYLKKMNNPD